MTIILNQIYLKFDYLLAKDFMKMTLYRKMCTYTVSYELKLKKTRRYTYNIQYTYRQNDHLRFIRLTARRQI